MRGSPSCHATPPNHNSGKLINPHNPEYITKRPWYLGESGPSLNHHAKQGAEATLGLQEAEEILSRKAKFTGRATTYRKGACENCGAMTHKKKDCLERPRSIAKSAKVSGMDIAPDEAVVHLEVCAWGPVPACVYERVVAEGMGRRRSPID
jgi:pre-mRNA-processing factor SLU7